MEWRCQVDAAWPPGWVHALVIALVWYCETERARWSGDWLGKLMMFGGFLVIELWIYQVIWKIPEELRAE